MATYDLGTARGIIEMQYNGRAVKEAEADLGGLEKKGMSTGQALKKTGRVTGLAGLAIAAGLGLAVKSAADFEQKISGINAVSGATPKQLEDVRNKALQLGKDTQFSATEAAAGIEELVKAGVTIPEVLNGAADAVTALAAAGGIDLPAAATISANAMNAFNIKAEDMNGVVDAIAGAANASAIDVGQFGESLQQVGAVAHLAGVDFHDTATAIAIMGNAGIAGSDAGTSLKTMFQRLQPTTKKQIDLMQQLGILTPNVSKSMQLLRDNGIKPLSKDQGKLNQQIDGLAASLSGSEKGSAKAAQEAIKLKLQSGALSNAFYTQDGRTKSLAQVSQVLQNSLKGMNERQKQMTLNTLFGSDAIRGAAILSEAGAKGFNKMAKSMDKVTAADVAKKRMDNLKGSLEQMKGSLETAGIAIGTALIPPLRFLVDMLTSVTNGFLSLSPATQKTIGFILAAVAAVLLIIAAVIKIVRFTQEFIAVLNVLKLAFAETWIAALGPIALVIAAIAAVVIIFIILYKKVGWFRDGVNAAFNWILNAVQNVFGWIRDHWEALLLILMGPFGLAVIMIIKNLDKLLPVLKIIGKAFVGLWNNFIKPAFGDIMTGVRTLGAIFRWLWNNAIQPAIHFIISALAFLMDMWGKMLGALGHLPGFGWAKDASKAMHEAATQARDMADEINKIPEHKDVNVTYTVKRVGGVTHSSAGGHDVPTAATGAFVKRKQGGSLYRVGEGGQDEVIVPTGNGVEDAIRNLMTLMGTTEHAARAALTGGYATPAAGSRPRPRRASRGGDSRMSRLVSGELRLDESGRAFIRGVAEDAIADSGDYADTLGRMGR